MAAARRLALLGLLLLLAPPAGATRPSDQLAATLRVTVRMHNRAGSRFVLDTELHASEVDAVIQSGAEVEWTETSPPTAFHKPELRDTARREQQLRHAGSACPCPLPPRARLVPTRVYSFALAVLGG